MRGENIVDGCTFKGSTNADSPSYVGVFFQPGLGAVTSPADATIVARGLRNTPGNPLAFMVIVFAPTTVIAPNKRVFVEDCEMQTYVATNVTNPQNLGNFEFFSHLNNRITYAPAVGQN